MQTKNVTLNFTLEITMGHFKSQYKESMGNWELVRSTLIIQINVVILILVEVQEFMKL